MKVFLMVILVLLAAVLTAVKTIRVPASWPQQHRELDSYYTTKRNVLSSTSVSKQQSTPVVDILVKSKGRPVLYIDNNKGVVKKIVNKGRHNNLKLVVAPKKKKYNFRGGRDNVKESKKSPIVSYTTSTRPRIIYTTTPRYAKPLQPSRVANYNHLNPGEYRYRKKYLSKSPIFETRFKEQDAIGTEIHEPIYREHQSFESFPISDHDQVPFQIPPSALVYPGEGLWAQKNPQYLPFARQVYKPTEAGPSEVTPAGYEVFDNLQNDFIEERKKFANDLESFPENHKLTIPTQQSALVAQTSEDQREDDSEEEGETTEFVPIRLYSQVRMTENEEHLPSSYSVEPNLKEVVKDSKIHTVYTEEGYEDTGYDHGAHVKHAESNEAFDEFNKENDVVLPSQLKQISAEDEDSDLAGTDVIAPVVIASQKNKFAKTTEVKTASLKDMGNGNLELEIKSQIKMLDTPHNGTQIHKYVNIYPKPTKALPLISIESTTLPSFSSLNFTKKLQLNIPQIDNETSHVIMKDIDLHFSRTKRQVDIKNLTRGFYKVDVDKFALPDIIPTTTEASIEAKYPYYNLKDPNVNVDSPLRYAEDMNNIPEKHSGNMAFYDQADRKSICDEPEADIHPVPERITDKENGETDDDEDDKVVPTPKLPRLGSLGDKIDCFKNKFFGENPLDSPIFTEETVGQPAPIFKEFEKFNEVKSFSNIKVEKLPNEQKVESITKKSSTYTTTTGVPETTPYFSLLTTPDYGVDVQPKHIYDQIDLLNNFSSEEVTARVEAVTDTNNGSLEARIQKTIDTAGYRQPKVSDLIFDLQNGTESKNNATYTLPNNSGDYYDDFETYNSTDYDNSNETGEVLPESLPLVVLRRRRRKRPVGKRPLVLKKFEPNYNRKRFTPNKYPVMSVSAFNQIFPTTTFSPKYNVISEVHYKDEIKPNEQLNVFADIINNIKNASMFESMNNEQNLKTQQTLQTSQQTEPITVKLNTNQHKTNSRRIKIPTRKIKIRKPDLDQSSAETQNVGFKNNYFYNAPTPIATTTRIPITLNNYPRKKNKITKEHRSNEQIYEEFLNTLKEKDNTAENTNKEIDSFYKVNPVTFQDYGSRKIKRRPANIFSPTSVIQEVAPPTNLQHEPEDLQAETTFTEGDVYPKNNRPSTGYTTIEEKPMNIYYVPGMLPPPSKEKPYLYSDYKLNYSPMNTLRRRIGYANHRMKRSAANYAEVTRTNLNRRPSTVESSEEVEDDDDDYVPHRPTRYHYDPETKRIIYDKTKEEDTSAEEQDREEDDEEEEEEEEVVVPQVITKRKHQSIQATTKAPPPFKTIYHKDVFDKKNGPTLIDYVNLVKSNPKYVEIKDPTTKSPVSDSPVTESPTTVIPGPTTPAAFLDILSKVRSNPDYKEIKDKEEQVAAKKTTTTEVPEPDEDAEEGENNQEEINLPTRRIQNSPGGQFGNGGQFQVFDISEYLPKVKNYNLKTSIDYSKYKTIERTTVPTRHHMSSKYNEDDDEDHKSDDVEDYTRASPNREVLYEELHGTTTTQTPTTVTQETTTSAPTTTIKPRVNIKRRRPTTTRATTTTVQEDVTTERVYTRATHRPPSRVYPRRPAAPHIRLRTKTRTTEATISAESEEVTTTVKPKRVLHRRHNTYIARSNTVEKVPSNHKPVYTPLANEGRGFDDEDQVEFLGTIGHFKLALPSLTRDDDKDESVEREESKVIVVDSQEEPTAIVVEEGEVEELLVKQSRLVTGDAKNSSRIYIDPNPGDIEPRNDDGNLERFDEAPREKSNTDSIDPTLLDVLDVVVKRITDEENKQRKPIPDAIASRSFQVSNNVKQGLTVNDKEVVSKGYIRPRKIDVEVFKNYDTSKKHGGNYKGAQDNRHSTIYKEVHQDNRHSANSYNPPTAYEIEDTEEIKRLTDIVPKPFAFYSDPKLPTNVNLLRNSPEVPKEVVSKEEEDDVEEFEDYDYNDAVRIFFRNDRKFETTTPRINVNIKGVIKDPSKRLYFYAPVD